MTRETVEKCPECFGTGWVFDYLGGCGDPECCGGPYKVRCRACENNWSPDDDDDYTTTRAQGEG